jgi:hypothetical protein
MYSTETASFSLSESHLHQPPYLRYSSSATECVRLLPGTQARTDSTSAGQPAVRTPFGCPRRVDSIMVDGVAMTTEPGPPFRDGEWSPTMNMDIVCECECVCVCASVEYCVEVATVLKPLRWNGVRCYPFVCMCVTRPTADRAVELDPPVRRRRSAGARYGAARTRRRTEESLLVASACVPTADLVSTFNSVSRVTRLHVLGHLATNGRTTTHHQH